MSFIISILLTLSAYADFGFYTQIEGLDNQATKSKIFQIYTPAGQYSSLPLSNKPVLLQGIEDLLEQGEIDSIQHQAVLFQLSYCEANEMDPCLLFLDIIKGTAFIAGKPGTVWTAFHNVSQAAIKTVGVLMEENKAKDYESVLGFMKQGRFPVYLVDEQGNLLIEPKIDESNWAQDLGFPYENIAEFFDGGEPPAERDFAKFVLPPLNIEPLVISEEIKVGQKVILGGYPASTGGKKSTFGALDSDGEGFYYGQGALLDIESFLKRQGYNSALTEDQELARSRQVLTTADAYAGHSGSPFLNQNGEVLGIFVEYLPVWMPTPKTNTSYGPNFHYIYEVLEGF